MKNQGRFAARRIVYFDILPGKLPSPPGSHRLAESFLGRETRREMLGWIEFAFAVRDFAITEEFRGELPTPPLDHLCETADFLYVDPNAVDHVAVFSF